MVQVLDLVAWNSCQVCVYTCPKSWEENGGEGTAVWQTPWGVLGGGDFSLSVFLCLSGEYTCPIAKISLKRPAYGIMVTLLDSHVDDHGSSPRPSGLKLIHVTCIYICIPKVPRGEWRRRNYSVVIPARGWFLAFCLSVSVCLSGERAHPMAKNLSKNKNKQTNKQKNRHYLWA